MSETILNVVAFKLAVLFSFFLVAGDLSARGYPDSLPINNPTSVAASPATHVPRQHDARMDELIHEMLTHD